MMWERSISKLEQDLNLPPLNPEIVKEAHRWTVENNGTVCADHSYNSPRISSELPDCSMPMTFDSYNYCSMGCTYCFAYFFKSNNPGIKEIKLKSVNSERMIEALRGCPKTSRDKLLHKHFYSKKFLLHWGGLADPFDSFEKTNNIGLKLVEALGEANYPTLFSSKGSTILDRRYLYVLEKYSQQKNFAFQTSIITNSDKLSTAVEIGVPNTTYRLKVLKTLSDMGYWTILRLRPFIIGISDMELEDLLGRALEAGVRGVSMEFFAMDGRANVGMKSRYDWLSKIMGVKDLQAYFKALSPSERGGYMRLNRLVKEPYVKTVYKFCADNNLVCGISDPDFKELNTSGSCCAMPDNYPENRLLENWTRSQLTYHVKEARRIYHKTGQIKELLFHEVYADESYLDEIAFTNDHVGTVGICTADAKYLTLRIILQRHWNNLGSPPNPRNYLHGKVMPTRTDENGNLVYAYNPVEYEARWAREGIDLTR